jgi:glucosamine-6-phosphate deaminase
MLILKTKNYKSMSKKASEILINDIMKKPESVVCFATGKTPKGMYKEIVKQSKNNKFDLSKIITFNLDEYYPIKKNNKNSYYYYMYNHLFNYLNIPKSNINLLDGWTKNPIKECLGYENKLKNKRIDFMILGVGVNGHLAFNEPGTKFNTKTRVVDLSENTIKINSKIFKNKKDMPKKALTLGIKNIMSSKKVILLASGKNKALAIKHLVKGNIDSSYPVTYLRKHKNLIIILDVDAASLIKA